MTNKKSGLLTFVFSLLPGAGEMYMGFMKQGISIMLLFFAIIGLGAWLELGPLLIVLPVIWCYSFFHVHNLRSLPEEEFYAMEDDYLIDLRDTRLRDLVKRFNVVIAIILILLGADMIWNNLAGYIGNFLPNTWYYLTGMVTHVVPQLLVGAIIIYVGVYLIKGKKKEQDFMDKDDEGAGGEGE